MLSLADSRETGIRYGSCKRILPERGGDCPAKSNDVSKSTGCESMRASSHLGKKARLKTREVGERVRARQHGPEGHRPGASMASGCIPGM